MKPVKMFNPEVFFKSRTGLKGFAISVLILFISLIASSQIGEINWSVDGNSYYRVEKNELVQYTLPENKPAVIISKQQLTPAGSTNPLQFSYYAFSDDQQKVLLFTNTKRVWRINSRGDYWMFDRNSGSLIQLGKTLPVSSLMFAKFSPDNATQDYLYRTGLNGKGIAELISPVSLKGTHSYSFSPNGKYASHSFSNSFTRPSQEIISVANLKPLNEKKSILARQDSLKVKQVIEFFKIRTVDSVEMDGWMVKPLNFDPAKKYPVVFYVYTEPFAVTVTDSYGTGMNYLYMGNMAKDGYIYISLDNRGTPAPKGAPWRKSIYRKIGQINIHDQAMAANEILKWDFVDPERIAVWGWSGGGSATLNLMFQYPEIYKTGIAIAAVANELTYDNIYQERYMGLPQENMEDFIKGSATTYAKNLKGNLLYIHGTGDDNVHYQNAEMLLNELIKYNKQFQFMAYPNRTHGISEGAGTFLHLATLYTAYLKKNCPPGGR